MADTVARLIFEADSKPIKTATDSIKELSSASNSAANSVKKLNNALANQGKAMSGDLNATQQATQQRKAFGRATTKASQEQKKSITLVDQHGNAIKTFTATSKQATVQTKQATDESRKAEAIRKAEIKAYQEAARRAKKLREESNKLTKSQNKGGKAAAKLSEKFSQAATSTAALQGPLNGLSGRLSFISTGLNKLGIAGLAASAGIFGLAMSAKNSLSVFAEYEEQMLRLDALFQSTGGAAGFTGAEINEMSERLAVATMASASDMRNAAGVLMTFKSISGEVFEESLRLTQDIGAVMGTSAVSGAKQLGKALEDPATNMTALTRAGISFTDSEKDRIKALQESGRLGEAQAFIIETLKNQVGGAGTGGGLSGAIDLVADNFGIFNRKLAEESGLAKIAEAQTLSLANAIGVLNDALTETPEEEIARLESELGGTLSVFDRIQDASFNVMQGMKMVNQMRAGGGARGGEVSSATGEKEARIQELQDQIAHREKTKEIAEASAEATIERQKKEAQQRREITLQENRDSLSELSEQILSAQGLEEEAIVAKQSRAMIAAENEFNLKKEAFGADIELLEQFRDKKIELAEAEATAALQRIADQAAAEAQAEKEKEDKKIEKAQKEAEQAAEKKEALEQGFIEQRLQAEEHEAMLRQDLVTAHERQMEILLMQQEAERVNAEEHGASLVELKRAQLQEVANLEAKQGKETVKLEEDIAATKENIEKKLRQSVLSLISSFGQNSKKLKVALLAADVGVALAENSINTTVGMGRAMADYPYPASTAIAGKIAMLGKINAAAIIAAGAMKIHTATSGGGGGGAGSGAVAASEAPREAPSLEDVIEAPRTINLTIDNSIDPEGARRIVEAINEVSGDGLMIDAVAI